MTHTPPARVLLCLGPCHGEFYLPLTHDDAAFCPNDSDHPVAVYSLTHSLTTGLLESQGGGLVAGQMTVYDLVSEAGA